MGVAGGDVDRLTNGQGAAALSNFRPDAVAPVLQIPEGALGGDTIAHFFEEMARKLGQGWIGYRRGRRIRSVQQRQVQRRGRARAEYVLGQVGAAGGLQVDAGPPIGSAPSNAPHATLRDWRQAVSDINSGSASLVIVHNADPVYGLPAGLEFGDALANENAAVFSASPFIDETTVMADVLIPDRAGLESWGDDAPNPGGRATGSYAVQQPVVNPLHDWTRAVPGYSAVCRCRPGPGRQYAGGQL